MNIDPRRAQAYRLAEQKHGKPWHELAAACADMSISEAARFLGLSQGRAAYLLRARPEAPVRTQKAQPCLEDWCCVGISVQGAVYGHPDHPDGTRIKTSQIQSLDVGKGVLRTLNSRYRLGKPLEAA